MILAIGLPGLFSLSQRPVGIRQVEVGDDPVRMLAGDVLQQFHRLRVMAGLLEQKA